MSRTSGHTADYGHIDLAFGEAAPAELYPLVEGWLGAGQLPGGPRDEREGQDGEESDDRATHAA